MIGEYAVVEWIQYVFKKWWKILIVVVVASLIMGIPKTLKSNSVPSNTNLHISEMITFENHDMYIDGQNVKYYYDYGDIWFRNPILAKFLDEISSKYDMSKFDKKWDKYGGMQKLDWIHNHFSYNPMSKTPSYAIIFSVDSAPENFEYVRENSKLLFKDFINYVEKSTKTYHPKSQIKELDFGFQETIPESKFTLATKNYILGGILGGMFMIFVYSVAFLVSKKVLSKKLLESRFHTDSINEGKNGLAYEILCYSVEQTKRYGKKLIVLSSTLEDKTFFGEVLAEFSKLGYSVLCADFSDSLECITDENIKLLDKNAVAEMKKPGRFVEQLPAIGKEFEYLVFYSPLVSNDRAALELFENSACNVFVENLGVSSKYPLEKTLSIIRKYASELSICLAWKK